MHACVHGGVRVAMHVGCGAGGQARIANAARTQRERIVHAPPTTEGATIGSATLWSATLERATPVIMHEIHMCGDASFVTHFYCTRT